MTDGCYYRLAYLFGRRGRAGRPQIRGHAAAGEHSLDSGFHGRGLFQ
jgi:hypothetical protein